MDDVTPRDRKGRFAKGGGSPNPGGRRPGWKRQLQQRLEEHGEAILDQIIEAARGGDLDSAKFLMTYVLPKPTGAERTLSTPLEVDNLQGHEAVVQAQREAVLAALAGKLGLGEARQIVEQLQIVGGTELRRRLEDLERSVAEAMQQAKDGEKGVDFADRMKEFFRQGVTNTESITERGVGERDEERRR